MFDATSAYTKSFTPTLGRNNVPLRGIIERTNSRREKALSFAAYRVLQHFYSSYTSQFAVTTQFFTSLGYNPVSSSSSLENDDLSFLKSDTTENNSTPSGIGNKVARLIIERSADDGANEYANEPGTKIGGIYFSKKILFFLFLIKVYHTVIIPTFSRSMILKQFQNTLNVLNLET